jgi:hypothetical protein
MFLITNMLEAIGLVLGSLLAAGSICWLASRVADRLHHRSWAAFLVLVFLAILLSGLSRSDFVMLSVIYGLFGALFLWLPTRTKDKRPRTLDRGDK